MLKLADSVERDDLRGMDKTAPDVCDLLQQERRFSNVAPGLDPRMIADATRRYASGERETAAFVAIPDCFEIAASRFESSQAHIAKVSLPGIHSGYSQNAASLSAAVFAAFLRCLARIATELED